MAEGLRNAFALLVGIGDYLHSEEVSPLPFAVRDAQALHDLLIHPAICGFPPQQVVLLTDAEAKRDAVVKRLGHWLPKNAKGAELVLIYFAGHGMIHPMGNQQQGFLLTHDAHPDDIITHGISMADVAQWIDGIQANAVLVCLDCCHAGNVLGPGKAHGVSRDLELRPNVLAGMAGKGRFLIASCDHGQKSFECAELEHGLFTYHLLEGIKGAGDQNGDGKVGIAELFTYVAAAVARDAKKLFHQTQTPWTNATYSDEAYIARTPTVASTLGVLDNGGRAETTVHTLENLLSSNDQEGLLKTLVRLKQKPDVTTAGVLCCCLTHTQENVRQLARQAIHALGWTRTASEIENLARAGSEQFGTILDGLGVFEAHRDLVALLDGLTNHLKGDLRNRAILLLERKQLSLELERMKELFTDIRSPYRLQRVLGQGLCTAAYLAQMDGTDLDVVVRVLRPELATQARVRAQFLDLSKRSLHFIHQNLVMTREVRAFTMHNIYFAVRDYVDGVTLQKVLEGGKRFEQWQVIHIIRQLLGALTPLHQKGVPHGGIKPSNIFLCGHDRLILGDPTLPPQGIGLALERLSYDYRYAAPEAFNKVAGTPADLYALGCVVYELLCGQPPFVADSYLELAVRHMRDVVKRVSFINTRVHPAWDRFLARLLAPNETNRFSDLDDVEQGLEQLQRTLRNPLPALPGSGDAALRPDQTMMAPPSEAAILPLGTTSLPALPHIDPPTIVPLLQDASVNQYRSMVSMVPFEGGNTQAGLPGTGQSPQQTLAPESGPSPGAKESPQQTIPGYQILAELGRGGMGVVYKARQERLDRLVAIKVLPRAFSGSEGVKRFNREAQAVARLQHPNIVSVYDLGEHQGQMYFSMEYCEGGTLSRLLREQPMAPRDAAALLVELAQGVQHAHENKILHRDLKPSNIMLAANGQPKIGDFGLARIQERGYHHDMQQTMAGTVVGTPMYMAPEQASGDQDVIGPCTDIYGLGAILYEMLTGKPPVRGGSIVQVLAQVLHELPPAPHELVPNIDPDLESICLRCLAKKPEDRYLTAGALADDLFRWLNGEPLTGGNAVAQPLQPVPQTPAQAPATPPVLPLPEAWSQRPPSSRPRPSSRPSHKAPPGGPGSTGLPSSSEDREVLNRAFVPMFPEEKYPPLGAPTTPPPMSPPHPWGYPPASYSGQAPLPGAPMRPSVWSYLILSLVVLFLTGIVGATLLLLFGVL